MNRFLAVLIAAMSAVAHGQEYLIVNFDPVVSVPHFTEIEVVGENPFRTQQTELLVQQNCPNGRCPLTNRAPVVRYETVVPPTITVVPTPSRSINMAPIVRSTTTIGPAPGSHTPARNGNWSHPNPLDKHMLNTHGVDISGMSYADASRLHSQIHEGKVQMTAQPANRSRVVTYSAQPTVTYSYSRPVTTYRYTTTYRTWRWRPFGGFFARMRCR